MITLFLICIVACLVWKVKTQDENSVKSTPTVTEEKKGTRSNTSESEKLVNDMNSQIQKLVDKYYPGIQWQYNIKCIVFYIEKHLDIPIKIGEYEDIVLIKGQDHLKLKSIEELIKKTEEKNNYSMDNNNLDPMEKLKIACETDNNNLDPMKKLKIACEKGMA